MIQCTHGCCIYLRSFACFVLGLITRKQGQSKPEIIFFKFPNEVTATVFLPGLHSCQVTCTWPLLHITMAKAASFYKNSHITVWATWVLEPLAGRQKHMKQSQVFQELNLTTAFTVTAPFHLFQHLPHYQHGLAKVHMLALKPTILWQAS